MLLGTSKNTYLFVGVAVLYVTREVFKIVPSPTEKFYDDELCYENTNFSLSNLSTDADKRCYTLLSQTFTNQDKFELLFIEFVSTPEVDTWNFQIEISANFLPRNRAS